MRQPGGSGSEPVFQSKAVRNSILVGLLMPPILVLLQALLGIIGIADESVDGLSLVLVPGALVGASFACIYTYKRAGLWSLLSFVLYGPIVLLIIELSCLVSGEHCVDF